MIPFKSSEDTLKNHNITILALLEIVLAIGIYWSIAVYFNSYLHIIASVTIAPLLLLKSEESVKFVLVNLSKATNSELDLSKKQKIYIRYFINLLLVICTFIMINFLINKYDTNWLILFKSLFVFNILVGIRLSLEYGYGLTLNILNVANSRNSYSIEHIFTAILVGGIIDFYIGYTGMYIITGAILGLFIFFFNPLHLKPFWFLIYVGMSIGSLIMITTYKIYATIMYLKNGIKNIQKNWYYNNFVVDMNKEPEVIFGIEKFEDKKHSLIDFKLSYISQEVAKHHDITAIIMKFIFKFFAIFYRISIKSTFWFYIPLLFLIRSPSSISTSDEIKIFLYHFYKTKIALLKVFIAFLPIILLIMEFTNFYQFDKNSHNFDAIIVIFYLDYASLEIWKIIQLLIVILTIFLFFYADRISTPLKDNNLTYKKDFNIITIFYLNIVRNWLTFIYLTFALAYVFNHFQLWEYYYIPYFTKDLIGFIVTIISYKPF